MAVPKPIQLGPFTGGLNLHDDPTAIADKELVEALNVEIDFDGSLKSRPAIVDSGITMPLDTTGNLTLLGYYYAPGNVPYLIGSDGKSSTYYFDGTTWTRITNTFSATAMAQFNGLAYLLAGPTSANPGGSWSPAAGFTADSNMPKGTVIVAHKFRLWVAPGLKAPANSTRLYYSQVLGQPSLWLASNSFIDVGAGDGQDIVQVVVYYQNLLIFRSASIFSFSFSSDISAGIISQVIPDIGLDNPLAMDITENTIYFTYQYDAYVFINNRVAQINQKVPFSATSVASIYLPIAVSIWMNRVIFSYYDTLYVYSLKTNTWTRWRSTVNGAIGKIVPLAGAATSPTAITHSSRAVDPASSTNKNAIRNPSVQVNLNDWTLFPTGGTGVLSRVSGIGVSGNYGAKAMGGNALGQGVQINTNLLPGDVFTPSFQARYIRGAGAGTALSFSIKCFTYDANANILDSWTDSALATVNPDGVYHLVTGNSHTVVAGAVSVVIIPFWQSTDSTIQGGDIVYIDQVTTDAGNGYYDGATTPTATYSYSWAGSAYASASLRTLLNRKAKTLTLSDVLATKGETFQCIIQTKNLSFDDAANFKRLFWWGVDAMFRQQLTGTAVPIVVGQTVTWGQLLSTTWHALTAFTWGSPSNSLLSVTTNRDTTGQAASRKFVKMLKSIWFRQLYFRLVFTTNGDTSTAPVRLFGITTYVGQKEVVSKAIS